MVGAGALVVRGREVLLVKRGSEPGKGKWSIPGGLVEVGEEVRSAAEREVEEEVGLKIRAGELIGVFDNIVRDPDGRVRFHYVIVDFVADKVEGSLRTSDEVGEAGWFTPVEAWQLDLTPTTRRLLKERGFTPT